ncbi:hypothetical protein BV22DRAFT_1038166 [Leucogyrophana mollusca]|uniref:Uncharacterized protein n=1 Tax=Leucogyrophana mollusca TaxID=85980 RepID=A0ACB8B8T4_9AGAM|nr:hypothetical protein BV22DRAFT_1038166 [Leucogyrophana mollusca]
MIVPNDAESSAKGEAPYNNDDRAQEGQMPPPAYYPQSNPSIPGVVVPQPPFKSKPTNFLELTKDNGHLRGEYVIDPTLVIASSYLPPLIPGQTDYDRNNLNLYTKNGHVQADIWLVGSNAPLAMGKRHTTLSLGSRNGTVVARIHPCNGAAPFFLNIYARNGQVTVFLPRSFNGALLLSPEHGRIAFSDGIKAASRPLGQFDGRGKYFVGHLPGEAGGGWFGDEVRVDSGNGHIRVRYVDESDDGIGSLLGRLIGF